MFFPFKDLSAHSRIWIYQSNRFLNEQEISGIKELAYEFVNEWTSHQQALHAGFEIYNNLFLVFAVDQSVNDTGGCSIDKLFQFVQYIEKLFDVKLLDRMKVAVSVDHEIEICNVDQAIDKMRNFPGRVFIYNNLISEKHQLQNEWLQPAENSWLKQMI